MTKDVVGRVMTRCDEEACVMRCVVMVVMKRVRLVAIGWEFGYFGDDGDGDDNFDADPVFFPSPPSKKIVMTPRCCMAMD